MTSKRGGCEPSTSSELRAKALGDLRPHPSPEAAFQMIEDCEASCLPFIPACT